MLLVVIFVKLRQSTILRSDVEIPYTSHMSQKFASKRRLLTSYIGVFIEFGAKCSIMYLGVDFEVYFPRMCPNASKMTFFGRWRTK
jgi:hypothetical protein